MTRNENIKTCSDDRFKHTSLIMIMKGPQSSVFDVSVVAAACNFLSTFACSPKRQTIDTVGTDSVDHCRAYLKCGEIKRQKKPIWNCSIEQCQPRFLDSTLCLIYFHKIVDSDWLRDI